MSSTKISQHDSGLKISDLNEFFLAYDSEFNKEDLHDRVLIFDVVKDQIQMNTVVSITDHSTQERPQTSNTPEEVMSPSAGFEGCSELKERVPILNQEQTKLSEELVEVSQVGIEQVKFLQRKRHVTDSEQQRAKKFKTEHKTDIIEETDGNVSGQVQAANDNMTIARSDFDASKPVIVHEHKIFVHATFLAAHSKYFRALFYSGMKETNSKEIHIKIYESEEESHLKMLEAIYRPYILDKITVGELLQILELANKYDVTYVFRKCKYLLEECNLTLNDFDMIINCIEVKQKIPSTSELSIIVRKGLAKEFNPLDINWQKEKFTNLSEALLRVMLDCEYLIVQSENTVFHALMHWIVCTGYKYRDIPVGTESLLSLVKFELLTIDYLYNVVQQHYIAKEMPSFAELYCKGITYHALPKLMKNPVLARQEPSGNVVQYTWVITKDELEILHNETTRETDDELNLELDNCFKSPRFWWCGYEMQMNLFDIRYSPAFPDVYAKLNLIVHGLKKRSRLFVKWFISIREGIRYNTNSTIFSFERNMSEMSHIVLVRRRGRHFNFSFPQSVSIAICITDCATTHTSIYNDN